MMPVPDDVRSAWSTAIHPRFDGAARLLGLIDAVLMVGCADARARDELAQYVAEHCRAEVRAKLRLVIVADLWDFDPATFGDRDQADARVLEYMVGRLDAADASPFTAADVCIDTGVCDTAALYTIDAAEVMGLIQPAGQSPRSWIVAAPRDKLAGMAARLREQAGDTTG